MPIKIAHVATVDMSLRYMLLNQMLSLREAGYDLTGISAPGPEIPAVEAAGIRYISVPMSRSMTPFRDLLSLWRLWRVMRRERFTVIHTHTPKAGLLGQLAARLAGVPVVVNTVHGFYFHEHSPWLQRRLYVLLEKIAALCSDLILSQNSEDVAVAVDEGICEAQKIRFLGNGFDLDQFARESAGPAEQRALRRELGLRENQPVIGFIGRLVVEKGLLELFRAFKILSRDLPDARLLLIGPVDHDKADAVTPEIAARYGLARACIFTGRRHDMPKLYSLLDVCVLPSHREGYPRVPMEASFMGVPSVVTDVRGCREVVRDGVNGLVVPLGDVDALAAAIRKILDNPALAHRLSASGRAIARKTFDERVVFQQVQSAYAELLARKGLSEPAGNLLWCP